MCKFKSIIVKEVTYQSNRGCIYINKKFNGHRRLVSRTTCYVLTTNNKIIISLNAFILWCIIW